MFGQFTSLEKGLFGLPSGSSATLFYLIRPEIPLNVFIDNVCGHGYNLFTYMMYQQRLIPTEYDVFNASPANLVILDKQGMLVAVNKNWQQFAQQNGFANSYNYGIGTHYIEFCELLANTIPELKSLEQNLQQLIQNEITCFTLEYPCHALNHESWFLLTGTALLGAQGGILLTHMDVTRSVVTKKILEIEKESYFKAVIQNKETALKEIIGQFHHEKNNVAESVLTNLKSFVLPVIDQMKIEKSFKPDLLTKLETFIHDLLSPFGKKIKETHELLSTKEMEIANLIRLGHNNKDLAKLLNISINTVITHRYRIRKKLKIKNKQVNLRSYLNKVLSEPPSM